jgi:hypothetical protein
MRRLAIVAMALGIPLVWADAAAACSCAPVKVREQLKTSDASFVGRLVAVREVDPPAQGEPIGSGDPMDYVYRVGRIYKDGPGINSGRRVRVRSVRDEATCGLPNRPGQLIGLFVNRSHRRWNGNLCLTTTPRRMRRGAQQDRETRHPSAGALSSITGIVRGARSRYCTQPG